jgi:flavin-dependent dehydrogenase
MTERPDKRSGRSHALVVGAGFAGLLAARVLVEHFEHVTVVERDLLPAHPEFRPGVPQSRHVHNLLVSGNRIINRLFPGVDDELMSAGAHRFEWPADFLWLSPVGWGGRPLSSLVTVACSRELLEWVLRRRLAATTKIRFVEGLEVTSLIAASGSRIRGVSTRMRHRSTSSAEHREFSADLVVDASGRDSDVSDWLIGLGYQRPSIDTVNSFAGYSTRLYARPRNFSADWKVLGVQSRPPESKRAGVIYSIEGDRWLVTLGGSAYDYPPVDETAFLAFARSLPTPLFAEAIEAADPLSSIFGYRRMENNWRRFERLPVWPDNLMVIGDAVCTFNPLYAQGMAVSAKAALLMHDELMSVHNGRGPNQVGGVGPRFQKALARQLTVPWLMATGEDFRYAATQGRRKFHTRITHAYLDRVIRVAASDPVVHHAFLEVMHLLRSPLTLLTPRVLGRVLKPRNRQHLRIEPPPRPVAGTLAPLGISDRT